MKIWLCVVGLFAVLAVAILPSVGDAAPLMNAGVAFTDAVSLRVELVRRSVAGRSHGVHHRARPVHPIVRPGVGRPVRPITRPGMRPVHPIARPGRSWVRPPYYTWRPGGAIAAGAALGFVAASAAVVYAGVPPAPGYCWYYTDVTRTRGFWDVCP